MLLQSIGIAVGAVAAYVISSLRVLTQYERGVVFFLGKYTGTREPGLIFVPSLLARMRRVSMRVVVLDIPPQDVITRDNISVKVNAVLYFRVSEPSLAVIEVQDFLHATAQLAQTTLLSVLGQVELDELLADRRKVNDLLRTIIDERTDYWGIEVSAVEIKDVLIPEKMRRAIARQAEAERERRAKVISAQGELQASGTLAEAAAVLQSQPASIQLRYLQTLTEIAAENNSTTIFPLPIDLFKPFMQKAADALSSNASAPAPPPVLPILPSVSVTDAALPQVKRGEPVK
jgi:regulator of protease activity HflC (stomatin/prohibitin superfamily)